MNKKVYKYPFLTAWVGLIVISYGAELVVGLAVSPVVMWAAKFVSASGDLVVDLIIPITKFAIEFIVGFFVFRFVVHRYIYCRKGEGSGDLTSP